MSRGFNASWFDKWGWLNWDEASERAFGFTSVSAFKELKRGTADTAFITRGYHNWKDPTIAFRNQGSSPCHNQAVTVMITIPATHSDVGASLSSMHGNNEDSLWTT